MFSALTSEHPLRGHFRNDPVYGLYCNCIHCNVSFPSWEQLFVTPTGNIRGSFWPKHIVEEAGSVGRIQVLTLPFSNNVKLGKYLDLWVCCFVGSHLRWGPFMARLTFLKQGQETLTVCSPSHFLLHYIYSHISNFFNFFQCSFVLLGEIWNRDIICWALLINGRENFVYSM